MGIFQRQIILLTVIAACLSSFAKAQNTAGAVPASTAPAKSELASNDLKYVMTTTASEEKFEDVTLVKSRKISSEVLNTELKRVSYGLRKKAVFGLVPVRVYVLQMLSANPEKLVRTDEGFLPSLKAANPVQLHLTFLRDLPGHKVADSFKEGLEANKVNVKKMSAELTQVMNQISEIQEFKKGEFFSITALWKDGQGSLLLEDNQKIKVIPSSNEFIQQIFSIWFGKAADGKLNDLRKDLFK